MALIEIRWLKDSYECDDCGLSVADGAVVVIDGEEAVDMTPCAHCYDGSDYDESEVYRAILERFGRWTSTADAREMRAMLEGMGHGVTDA